MICLAGLRVLQAHGAAYVLPEEDGHLGRPDPTDISQHVRAESEQLLRPFRAAAERTGVMNWALHGVPAR